MRSTRSQGRWSARNGTSSAIQSRWSGTVADPPGCPTRARLRRSVSVSSAWTQIAASIRCMLSRRAAPTPSMMSSEQPAGTSIAPGRWCSSHAGGRNATGRPARAGSSTPPISRSAQPNRECHQAMSSVCTTADPATASRSRAASVVLPLELRPSTATTTGRSPAPRSRPSRITVLATSLTSSVRHGPASGSSGVSRNPTVISLSPAGPGPSRRSSRSFPRSPSTSSRSGRWSS